MVNKNMGKNSSCYDSRIVILHMWHYVCKFMCYEGDRSDTNDTYWHTASYSVPIVYHSQNTHVQTRDSNKATQISSPKGSAKTGRGWPYLILQGKNSSTTTVAHLGMVEFYEVCTNWQTQLESSMLRLQTHVTLRISELTLWQWRNPGLFIEYRGSSLPNRVQMQTKNSSFSRS